MKLRVWSIRAPLWLPLCLLAAVHSLAQANDDWTQFGSGRDRAIPRMDILSDGQWEDIDRAINRGLDWLASQQFRDGSFQTDFHGNPGVTSLCVLAMMSGNHFPETGRHGRVMSRAMEYILSTQKPNGLLSVLGPEGRFDTRRVNGSIGSAATYNHAISALALTEGYAMTRTGDSSEMRRAIEAATRFSVEFQQHPKRRAVDVGGWRYLSDMGEMDADLSVTGWYLMSLRSAKNAGFAVPQSSIDLAVQYVLRCFNPREGTFYYGLRPRRIRSRGMAGAGIIALAHAGFHDAPAATVTGDWILNNRIERYNETRFPKDTFHYGAFYCCQAMYQLGGRYWEEFYPRTALVLLRHQQRDGGWPPEAEGSERRFGRTYSTALAVLALSAPNQVLPIFQR